MKSSKILLGKPNTFKQIQTSTENADFEESHSDTNEDIQASIDRIDSDQALNDEIPKTLEIPPPIERF